MDNEGHDWQIVTTEYHDCYMIRAEAAVRDNSGKLIGYVDTDALEFAQTQLGALIKAYFMERKIKNGKLTPSANF